MPFDSAAHPHAPAGSPDGGQFAAIDSNGEGSTKPKKGGGKGKGKGGKKKAAHRPVHHSAHGTLGLHAGYGKQGGDPRVTKLQTALNRLGLKDAQGHRLKVDGKLGPKTTAAVKAAQRQLGLPQDGKVSPALLRKLSTAKTLNPHPAIRTMRAAAKTTHATRTAKAKPAPASKSGRPMPVYPVGGA